MPLNADTPGLWPVSLDGIGFNVDDSDGNPGIVYQSLRTQREQQSGSGANIGESTVNPEGFWRRSRDGWHHGAGQTYADREESDPLRFRTSQGVDVFSTKHQASLLNTVEAAYTFPASSAGWMVQAGSRVYIRENDTVKYTTAPLTVPWATTTVTGTVAGGFAIGGLATDGVTVYIASGVNGIYTTDTGSSAAASFVTGQVDTVFYAKGRLFGVVGGTIYNPVAAGALPSALLALPSGYRWAGVTEGPNHIYMLANNDSVALIYKTSIKPDGTGLDVPTVAGELLPGEIGLRIYGYVGKLFIASSRGVRMADIDENGNLIIGSVIPISEAGVVSNAFVGEDRFVWYGIRSTGANGTGRMDLTVETLPNTPAYAADVADGGSARNIISMTRVSGKLIYTTYGGGTGSVFVESSTPVASGYIDSGLMSLDLADLKTAVSVDVEAAFPSTTSITEALSVDRGSSFTTVDTFSAANSDEAAVTGVAAARNFELRSTLTSVSTNTPVLYRHTLKVEPGVSQGLYIILRLRLFENEIGFGGQRVSRSSVASARQQLVDWQSSREVIVAQIGSTNHNVTVRDIEWTADMSAEAPYDGEFNGVCVTRLKVVSDAA